jgi:hypothetical protein
VHDLEVVQRLRDPGSTPDPDGEPCVREALLKAVDVGRGGPWLGSRGLYGKCGHDGCPLQIYRQPRPPFIPDESGVARFRTFKASRSLECVTNARQG